MPVLFRKKRQVLVDVDTQVDIIAEECESPCPALRQLRRVIAWARVRDIPIISTAINCRGSTGWSGETSCLRCIENTPGQEKLHLTLLPNRIHYDAENRFDLPPRILKDYSQVIFERRCEDPLELPRFDRLITESRFDEFIIVGTSLETALKATALGLIHRRKAVTVLTDALLYKPTRTTQLALRQMEAKGATLSNVADYAGSSRIHGAAGARQLRITASQSGQQ